MDFCPAELCHSLLILPLVLVSFKPVVLLFAQSFVHRIDHKYKWVNIVIAIWKVTVDWRFFLDMLVAVLSECLILCQSKPA